MQSGFDLLDGRSILVTGGSGSFGRRFVETVLRRASPRRVIVFSRDEFKQYEMQQQLGPEWASTLRFFIGDVRDRERLELAMREVDVCVHAAALKHVPAAEYNPMECIHTNVYGAENVVRAALNTGVKRVIALSTDKAANPVNLYGASKLASDKIFIAANNLSGSLGTRFSVVRYGNVVGSRGSVIPLFRKMIAEGAEALPVTDERMTRFWITLQHGVDFVVSCIAMMQGGEIFVPKIPSMRITDLARAMAPHLPHKPVGIRPGEKLHEVMITEDDSRQTFELPDRFVIEPAFAFWTHEPYQRLGAQPVADGFRYASDTNTDWLDGARLMRLIAEAP
ncbi:UDP-N-acetylglucosamine 4,6-dehydratase (inverting) [Azospirillum brasilense]|uniref:UDP-N-acetylglucosamine 4,6-dehydratase (Inverting) n=1 Tax=Azospirillum brasilense TaxID=192 RepID=A0A6L3ASU0_AZOBR|nr:UDP-N-acetylglucosamine 4,6-dehydratase (inverting) [Azospirillum brasilense]